MIPAGSISVFVHLIINVCVWIIKKVPFLRPLLRLGHLPPLLLAGVLVLIMFVFAGWAIRQALLGQNNLDHIDFYLTSCTEFVPEVTEQNVIIRVDDIQSFAWVDIQQRIILDAAERDIPLSVAVIPVGLRDDPEQFDFLRQQRCQLEFMLHGYDNLELRPGVGEFAELREREAEKRIEQGLKVVDKLAREDVYTFVPPLNMLSEGAKRALAETDIPLITSEGEGRFDFDATTFDFIIDEITTPEAIVADCEAAFAAGDKECVVMVHPQDFVTNDQLDPEKYQVYLDSIDQLKAKGYTFVRFKDIYEAEDTD